MTKKTIKDLKFDQHNFNAHTPEGMEMLDKSISDFGFGRSVVVDKNDNLIAGNGVVETALKQGKTKIIEIETDGTELVVVKRKDVDINTEYGREMAFADNVTAKVGIRFNEEELRKAKEEWNLSIENWGVELPEEIDIDEFIQQQGEEVTFNTKQKLVIVIPKEIDIEVVKTKVSEALKEFKALSIR